MTMPDERPNGSRAAAGVVGAKDGGGIAGVRESMGVL